MPATFESTGTWLTWRVEGDDRAGGVLRAQAVQHRAAAGVAKVDRQVQLLASLQASREETLEILGSLSQQRQRMATGVTWGACAGKPHLHALHAHVHRHKGDEALGQQLPNDLPDAPEARDDDVPAQLLRLPLRRLQRLFRQPRGCVH